jgi:hypothetical protein
VDHGNYVDRTLADPVDEAIPPHEDLAHGRDAQLWNHPTALCEESQAARGLLNLESESPGVERGISRDILQNFEEISGGALRPDYGSSHFAIRRSSSS